MDNSVNSVSFKANIIPVTKIKNKAAFVEVKELFKKGTKNCPNENLYITDASLGEVSLRLSKDSNILYPGEDFYTKDIDKQIEEMGIEQFSKKLIKTFKALKLYNEASKRVTTMKNELKRAKNLLANNNYSAENWHAEGKDFIAHRYEILAENNKGVIDRLTKELEKCTEKYNKQLKAMGNKYNEFNQLKIFNLDK